MSNIRKYLIGFWFNVISVVACHITYSTVRWQIEFTLRQGVNNQGGSSPRFYEWSVFKENVVESKLILKPAFVCFFH